MTRYNVVLPIAMHTSAATLADQAGKALGCKVSHSALIRAALIPWIRKAEHGPLTDTQEDIRRAEPPHGTRQRSSKPAWSKELNGAIDKLRKRLVVVPTVGFLRMKKPEIDFFTFEEAARILESAEHDPWYVMILCGLRAGLRQGELLELRWSDVDLLKGVLRIRRAIYDGVIDVPKGGRTREVPLGDELRAALRELPSRFAGELVWPGEGGRNLTKGEAKWPLWRACKRAGLRRVGWHALRHTFASHLVMRGVPLKAIQELLGHATIDMTMRYAHLAPDVSRDAVRLLDAPAPVRKASGAE